MWDNMIGREIRYRQIRCKRHYLRETSATVIFHRIDVVDYDVMNAVALPIERWKFTGG